MVMIMKPYLFHHNDKVICELLKWRGGANERMQLCFIVSRQPKLLQSVFSFAFDRAPLASPEYFSMDAVS